MTEYEIKCLEEVFKPAYVALMKFYPLTLEDLDGEEWHDVAGYEGLYQISTFGRVKRFYKYRPPRIRKPSLNVQGYLTVTLCKKQKPKTYTIHRLVALTFIPNPNFLPEVDHCSGIKLNNHVENLEWVTNSENKQRALRLGLRPSGGEHQQAKLTDEQAKYIRDNPENLNTVELAKVFGVSEETVSGVQLGKRYKTAGGRIRKKKIQYVPVELRKQIRAEYMIGVYGHGYRALAKKYHIAADTVWKILHEK